MITATLPPYAQPGDALDANISSMGDARSLLGGTLLLTHLMGSNGEVYALAQGPISVGGFSFDLNGNLVQKNHPTAATLSGGATVERATRSPIDDESPIIQYVLFDPDLGTAKRIADSINSTLGGRFAHALDPARVRIELPVQTRDELITAMTKIEDIRIVPDVPARVVINERTGTVVSGGNVLISPITITHGDLNVTISTEFIVSQPSFVFRTGPGVRTVVVPDTTIDVEEEELIGVNLPNSSTIAELVTELNRVKATSRDVITILQSIKTAGALHAELIIQ
jgi:flagellar P-ring protein precursor FlgI